MLARAHATTPGAASDPVSGRFRDGAGVPLFARYFDIVLVIAGAPLMLISGMPRFGYVLGAGGWIVFRFVVELLKRRAWMATDTRSRAILHLSAIFGRVWLI